MSQSVEYLYTSNMGVATISTANTNLDGTGTIGTIITGSTNGTLVKTLIIKSQSSTSEGMVRIFVKKSGGSNVLLEEIYVPPVTKSSRDQSFSRVINLNYTLMNAEELKASTQTSDTFNVIAEGFDITFAVNGAFIGPSLEFIANAGNGTVSTANGNLDGSGTLATVFTAGTSASGYSGCAVTSIMIKAQVTTTPGMVRLFVDIGGTVTLFAEVVIPSWTRSGTIKSFSQQVIGGSFCIPAGSIIKASTQVAEAFNVVVDGQDWISV